MKFSHQERGGYDSTDSPRLDTNTLSFFCTETIMNVLLSVILGGFDTRFISFLEEDFN